MTDAPDQGGDPRASSGAYTEAVDLSNCDREPIHLLGAVQDFGFLVAASPDWTIRRASANCGAWLGAGPDELIGRQLTEAFSEEAVHGLRNRMQHLRGDDAVERLFGQSAVEGGPPLDLALHLSDGLIVIEGEASQGSGVASVSSTMRTMLARLQAAPSLDRLIDEAARLLQALTGYERVMVYRFSDDGSGEVIAEARRGGIEGFLGQRFPAADIPRQARRLYLRNWVRVIADARSEPVPLRPAPQPGEPPLDLSMSVLRSVSPIHLEYLGNMGLRGSMSASVIVGGKLWGLLACHSREPLVVPLETRTSVELFAQVFSLLLETRQREEEAAYEERAQSLHRRLVRSLTAQASTAQNLLAYAEEMQQVLNCDGVGVWSDGEATLRGDAPSGPALRELVRFLKSTAGGEIYATHHLGSVWPEGETLLPRVAGLLALPISRTPRDYLLFFRREIADAVIWAGDPAKAVASGPAGPNGPRLTPRKSFEAWQEVVRGQAPPWTLGERRFADALRVMIREVVLRLTEEAERDREQARQKQELLIAELNHRVRNILALMRAIVGQSREGAESVEEFSSVLGDRIQALARAHDQITRDHWGPASLRSLVEAETSAYLGSKAGRVRLEGPEVLLQARAFSTLALVIHELVTNAAKHGALCDSSGSIGLTWRLTAEGDLEIRWQELNGPPVQAPQRRGFGSTIIERSLPYDLGGEARVDYLLDGLRARFLVPAQHVARQPGGNNVEAEGGSEAGGAAGTLRAQRGRALVVEDNMIVAMEAEEILRQLGFEKAESAASVASALSRIELHRPDFALLDVNLGRETSFPIADRLDDLGIPFLFATGYGDQARLPERHRGRPKLAKPFNERSLRDAFDVAATGEGGVEGR